MLMMNLQLIRRLNRVKQKSEGQSTKLSMWPMLCNKRTYRFWEVCSCKPNAVRLQCRNIIIIRITTERKAGNKGVQETLSFTEHRPRFSKGGNEDRAVNPEEADGVEGMRFWPPGDTPFQERVSDQHLRSRTPSG